ncbi:hypothetical protein [Actinomadura sp. WMMA1423]|uniref:hypothetical protein n=1 Tax=Actinomadura sp. WMMA1423 TaxID=2591108 RepID=UPI0011465DFA|nr:hypothetical protein [Actinomadura sp. WMMA1423]
MASHDQEPQPDRRDRRVVEAAAAVLAAGLTATAAAAALRRALQPLRLAAAAIRAAVDLAARILPDRPPRATGRAQRQDRRDAHKYRAWYLVNAARRIHTAIKTRSRGETVADAVRKALRPESRYLRQHLAAQQNRRRTAIEVDRLAAIYGDRLGWYAVRDGSTTADCRHAHGRDFLLSKPPRIGLPGSVHSRCRCRPGRPWGTRLLT